MTTMLVAMKHSTSMTRRDAILGTLVAASGAPAAPTTPTDVTAADADSDFSFLNGSWRVHHRMLKDRLAGSSEWWEFEGRGRAWLLLGGGANVDDNIFYHPKGTYRGATIRRQDPVSRQWSIWWLDGRSGSIDAGVRGGFKDGVGMFFGDAELRGKPVSVRYVWTRQGARTARWEQAFSADQGKSWETNWIMDFEREA